MFSVAAPARSLPIAGGSSSCCPLCLAPAPTTLHAFESEQVAEFFVSKAVSASKHDQMRRILESLWEGTRVSIRWCEPCDFGFADRFVAGSAEFYALQSPDTPYPRSKWEFVRTIEALTPSDRTVLEIGAGKGHFFTHLIRLGWQRENLLATEFSAAGRAAIDALSVACFNGDVRDLDTCRRFDAICLFQVLEHLDGYDELFDALSQLAAPKGRLFVAVPNGRRIAFNERIGLLPDCPPNHVSRWSPASFASLARSYGWTLEHCELEPAPSVIGEIRYAAINRFLRNSHDQTSWARQVNALSKSRAFQRGHFDKVLKAAGLALSPDVWAVSARAGLAARRGGVPHALWAELRKAH